MGSDIDERDNKDSPPYGIVKIIGSNTEEWKKASLSSVKKFIENEINPWEYDFGEKNGEPKPCGKDAEYSYLNQAMYEIHDRSDCLDGYDVMHNPKNVSNNHKRIGYFADKASLIQDKEYLTFEKRTHTIGNFSPYPELDNSINFQAKHNHLAEWWDIALLYLQTEMDSKSFRDFIKVSYLHCYIVVFYDEICRKKPHTIEDWPELIEKWNKILDDPESKINIISLVTGHSFPEGSAAEFIRDSRFDDLKNLKDTCLKCEVLQTIHRINWLIEARARCLIELAKRALKDSAVEE